jgi:hypothetical protein
MIIQIKIDDKSIILDLNKENNEHMITENDENVMTENNKEEQKPIEKEIIKKKKKGKKPSYLCKCGSKIINKKSSIDRHFNTLKHKNNYIIYNALPNTK